jgi:UDP-3-O-[3-hydroxymyristoyl] glucosamine N-acyltransferase
MRFYRHTPEQQLSVTVREFFINCARKKQRMKITAEQIAKQINGVLEGDPSVEVYGVARIEEAGPGTLAFLANMKYADYLYTTGASVVLIPDDFQPEAVTGATLIRVVDPYTAFAGLLDMYQTYRMQKQGISSLAFVHTSAVVGEGCYIGEFASIGEGVVLGRGVKVYPGTLIGDNSVIGDETILYSGVKIYYDIRIGAGCIIHSGAVIGADGFGFAVQSDRRYKKVPQVGNVVIEDHVEVGANTTIDRATLGSTMIRRGVKLDNQVQIAHNVEIGSDTVIAAQTGISGSVKIGSRCLIAGQVGFVGHIRIADDVTIGAQSGVAASISEPGAVVLGSPAIDASLYKRILVWFRRLPDLGSRVGRLEKSVSELNK